MLVKGRLRVRPFRDREGAPRIAVEVEAQSVGHDLTRGVAHFSRTHRAAGETAAESADALAVSRPATDGEDPAGPPAEEAAAGSVGDGVLDERAVAQFASELSRRSGEGPVPPGETGIPADDGPDMAEDVPAEDVPAEDVPADGAAVPF